MDTYTKGRIKAGNEIAKLLRQIISYKSSGDSDIVEGYVPVSKTENALVKARRRLNGWEVQVDVSIQTPDGVWTNMYYNSATVTPELRTVWEECSNQSFNQFNNANGKARKQVADFAKIWELN